MSTRIMRHPDPATLMGFSAGTLVEPLAAVVASHIDVCEECLVQVADLDRLGAVLLTSSVPLSDIAAVAMVPSRSMERAPPDVRRQADPFGVLPAPLAQAFQLSFDRIPWKRLGPGVWHHRLPLSPGATGDLRLLKIGPGRVMPGHGHGGAELTLVLDGAFTDKTGAYLRGDIQDVDETIEHTPVADKDIGCICLIASERPARFRGLVGRLLQPWTGL